MEIAGLAVGVVSLYNSFIEVLKFVDAYKDFGLDAQLTTDRYNASKLRLQLWAKTIGMKDGKLIDPHDARLNDPQIASIIKSILRRLTEVFDRAEYLSSAIEAQKEQQSAANGDYSIPQQDERIKVEQHKVISKRSRFAWALRRKDRFSKDVHNFEGLVNILHDVVPPREADLRTLTNLHNLDQKLEVLSDFDAGLGTLMDAAMITKQKEFDDWLDVPRDDDQYERNAALRLNGTCDWIFSHASFTNWMAKDFTEAGSKLLWISGPAGFGKSVLCARIIQNLRAALKSPVAYCFSSSPHLLSTQLDGVLRTWAAQLAREDQRIVSLAQLLRQQQKSRRASREEVWSLLKEISTRIKPFVLVLDGLDEFKAAQYSNEQFLRDMKTSFGPTRIRILITSRNEIDIESELNSLAMRDSKHVVFACRIAEANVRNDLALFSQAVVDRKLPKKELSFRQELAGQIAERCEGMFLWIKLQQERLRGGKSKRELREIVQQMPQGLHLTYRRSWNNIEALLDQDRQRAVEILRWVAFAYRPLTVQELTEALVVDFDVNSSTFSEDLLPDIIDDEYINGEIRGLCGSLVEVRPQSGGLPPNLRTVHLVHASVRDFLHLALPLPSIISPISNKTAIIAAQNLKLATTCLRFLNSSSAWTIDGYERIRPFALYATDSWFKHISDFHGHDDSIYSLVKEFLDPRNRNFERWRGLYESWFPYQGVRPNGSQEKYTPATPFYYACLFGLLPVMDSLHDHGKADINAIGGPYGSALEAVCMNGHSEAFQRLIRWGAQITIKGGLFGNALIAAATYGRLDMVREMLDRGAEPDLMGHRSNTLLMAAAAHGHIPIVQLLLDRGASVNPTTSSSKSMHKLASTPLHGAVKHGHLVLVKMLLDHGANIDAQDEASDTCLHLAVSNNDATLVSFLLERGANANLRGWENTPLYTAARNGFNCIATSLLEKGADPRSSTIRGWTPLLIAAKDGHRDIVDLLLARGADINDATDKGETALFLAAAARHVDIAALLLQRGAEFPRETHEGTMLHLAANYGSLDLVKAFIGRGSDVNSRAPNGLTPLHQATRNRHLTVVELLLHHQAKVQSDFDGLTPLHIVADEGYSELAIPLLQGGADIHARDKHGWTPFFYAISKHRFNVAELLLSQGLDHTALTCRKVITFESLVFEGNKDHFKRYIERDLDAKSSKLMSDLLRGAILQGSNEMVEVLIEIGADTSIIDSFGMSARDWLRLLRPSHKALQNISLQDRSDISSGPHLPLLRQTIVDLCAASMDNTLEDMSDFYKLGRCLLLIGSEDEARTAYEQRLLRDEATQLTQVLCDICDARMTEERSWFVCKTCPGLDFCGDCMNKYPAESPLEVCRNHQFLRVVAMESRFQRGQSEALDRWLNEIMDRYRDG